MTEPETTQRPASYDIVLFGATGFTGGLTAEYLAEHAPAGLRWALAGRNESQARGGARAAGDASTPRSPSCRAARRRHRRASLRDVARGARVVITTVGPYLSYGEPLVAACAAAGTDYVDLTGEPEFVDRMYLAHHDDGAAYRRPHRPRLRLRLHPARPRRLLHGPATARGRAAHGARLRPGRGRPSPAARSTPR